MADVQDLPEVPEPPADLPNSRHRRQRRDLWGLTVRFTQTEMLQLRRAAEKADCRENLAGYVRSQLGFPLHSRTVPWNPEDVPELTDGADAVTATRALYSVAVATERMNLRLHAIGTAMGINVSRVEREARQALARKYMAAAEGTREDEAAAPAGEDDFSR